jgi:hypothetical protein
MSSKKKEKKKFLIIRLPFLLIKWLFIIIYRIFRGILNFLFRIISFPIRIILNHRQPTTGEEYERWCCRQLDKKGFYDIKITKRAGDHGIDIIARAGRKLYAIQCKFYAHTVGNFAVQEAYTGCAYYECDVPVVLTNSTFSKPAVREAEKLEVELWPENSIPRKHTFFAKLIFTLFS